MPGKGLYANIHAKKKRIAAGSGEKMRKPGLKSPDLADAVCLTMASDAAMALSGPMVSWRGSLRRGLRGIA